METNNVSPVTKRRPEDFLPGASVLFYNGIEAKFYVLGVLKVIEDKRLCRPIVVTSKRMTSVPTGKRQPLVQIYEGYDDELKDYVEAKVTTGENTLGYSPGRFNVETVGGLMLFDMQMPLLLRTEDVKSLICHKDNEVFLNDWLKVDGFEIPSYFYYSTPNTWVRSWRDSLWEGNVFRYSGEGVVKWRI